MDIILEKFWIFIPDPCWNFVGKFAHVDLHTFSFALKRAWPWIWWRFFLAHYALFSFDFCILKVRHQAWQLFCQQNRHYKNVWNFWKKWKLKKRKFRKKMKILKKNEHFEKILYFFYFFQNYLLFIFQLAPSSERYFSTENYF